MGRERSRTWSYSADSNNGDAKYVIRAGGTVIGRTELRGDADQICRARRDAVRQAVQRAADARRHRLEIMRLRNEIRELISGLHKVAGALKQAKLKEITAARESVTKILKRMKARGYGQ
jgi:hypothetical protein